MQLAARRKSFADGYSLLLATRHATDRCIAYEGVLDMAQTKDGLQSFDEQLHMSIARHSIQARARRSSASSEAEGLVDSKSGEVNVVFGAILHVSAVVPLDLLRGEGVVPNFTFNRVEILPLICEDFQQCAASGAWASEDTLQPGVSTVRNSKDKITDTHKASLQV